MPIDSVPTSPDVPGNRSFGILSTFPPTSCGIATFSAALSAGLIATGASVDVVRCGPSPLVEDPLVLAALVHAGDRADAVFVLNTADVAIVQHEYGIYDGPDGESLIGLMEQIDAPTVLVAHTVPSAPTPNQRRVLERVCALADVVVVMTETALTRLVAGFDVPAAKVIVIPHGAATPPAHDDPALPVRPRRGPARLLTWGLLGPGKGIEWAIDAVAALGDVEPHPQYLVAGATHPKVRAHSGEVYREMLVDRAARSSAARHIAFDDTYRDLASLTELIHSADVVVLPYDSQDQVTSGVLVDAIAAGRPVVATEFPHACELLASGAGIVVPRHDPDALTAAIRSIVTDPDRAAAMRAQARRLAPGLSWGAVARRYAVLGERLHDERRPVAS